MTIDVISAIEARRSVRAFDPEHRLSDAEIERLLTVASRAPSAFNLQHWRFVVVKDAATRSDIRGAAWNQAQVTDASLLVVLVANLEAWTDAAPMWGHVDDQTRATYLGMIDGFYRGRDGFQRDEAMRSIGLVAQTLMLAAAGMGLASCPMDGFDPDAVSSIIGVPKGHAAVMMVAVGKETADAPAIPATGRLPLSQTVIVDRFPR
jgi:nitroreductase